MMHVILPVFPMMLVTVHAIAHVIVHVSVTVHVIVHAIAHVFLADSDDRCGIQPSHVSEDPQDEKIELEHPISIWMFHCSSKEEILIQTT